MIVNWFWERAARLFSRRVGAVCGDGRWTYAQMDARIQALASHLAAAGVARGDRVALLLFNCHRFIETTHAVARLGAVIVPLNTRVPPAEHAFVLRDCGARALVVDGWLAPQPAALSGPPVRVWAGGSPPEGFLFYEDLTETPAPGAPQAWPEPAPEDLYGLFYTSGTTGNPKGVMLSHRNAVANCFQSAIALRTVEPQVFLHAAPMFHLADFPAVHFSTMLGSTQVMLPRFDPASFCQAVAHERVTHTVLVPTMINLIVHFPGLGDYDLSSVQQILYGASAMPPELLRAALRILPCRFAQGYGLSEAGPLLSVLDHEDHVADGSPQQQKRLTSAGRPLAGVLVRVVDEQGSELPPGRVGEVVARGASVMMGYWNQPEETGAALAGGWLHSGDLASMDEDGYLYIVDRKKDMIISGGENIYSTEVEAVLYAHPAVREAAVFGVPDNKWIEAVKAVVVLKPGAAATPGEIEAFCRQRLAGYKVPRSIEINATDLPKSGTGKILKKALRAPYWEGKK